MDTDAALPAALVELHAGWRCVEAHRNRAVTWRLEHADGRVRYLKVGTGLEAEAARMRWARRYQPVPEVLASGRDGEREWLLTAALPGSRITNPQLRERPDVMVPLLAEHLRRFHDTPRHDCPFDLTLTATLGRARERIGRVSPHATLDPDLFSITDPVDVLAELERTRPAGEDLVVCHGDYSPPNVIVADDAVIGVVDLCDLGVADRWWDLSIGSWHLLLGPEWEDRFCRAYGIEPDRERIAYYRMLYDLHRLLTAS